MEQERRKDGGKFVVRCFALPAKEIGYLRFVLEGYDGLAQLRTLEPSQALVEIIYALSQHGLMASLLVALQDEIGLQEASFPLDYSPL